MLGIGRRDAGIEGPAGRESGGRAHPVKARGMSRSPPFACSVDRMPAHGGHPLAGRAYGASSLRGGTPPMGRRRR